MGKNFEIFLGDISPIYRKYRRYIGDIFDISVDISARKACGADLLCRKSDGPDQASFFQTASLTDLMAIFESGLIQRPRFHPDL